MSGFLRIRTKSTTKKNPKDLGISSQQVFTERDLDGLPVLSKSQKLPRTTSTPDLHDAAQGAAGPMGPGWEPVLPPPPASPRPPHGRSNSFALGTPIDASFTPPWVTEERSTASMYMSDGESEFGQTVPPHRPGTPDSTLSDSRGRPEGKKKRSFSFGRSKSKTRARVDSSPAPPVPSGSVGPSRNGSISSSATLMGSSSPPAKVPFPPSTLSSPPATVRRPSLPLTSTALASVPPDPPAPSAAYQQYDPAHPATDPNWSGRATGLAAVSDQPGNGEMYLKKVADASTIGIAYIAGEESAAIAEGPTKLAGAYNAVGGADGVKNAVELVDKAIDQGTAIFTQATAVLAPVKTVVSDIKAALETDDGFKQLEAGVTSAVEKSEVLMKALGAVGDIHPAIGAAIFIFKTVINLELKRRDNDRKLGTLRVGRNEMMEIVADLSKVKDKASVASDARIIKVMTQIGTDIKDCQNACEVYAAKKLVVQVLCSDSWNVKLAAFGTRFQTRKDELQQALVFHTALGVDEIGRKMDAMADGMKAMQESNNMLMLMQMMQSPRERNLMELIKKKGGAGDVMKDDNLLREIMDSKEGKEFGSAAGKGGGKGRDDEDFKALRKDLATDIDVALQRNQAFFDRKFEAQEKQLKKLEGTVVEQADRVIKSLTATVADRIKNEEIKKMWKDMGWKSSVKTSRFVNALRDYYIERFSADGVADQSEDEKKFVEMFASTNDQWTLSYINFARLQPINEAFDDDASGFVSIMEVNEFTDTKPPEWSLPHWVAFWAAGWHLSLLHYQYKIQHEIMPRILRAAKHVLPANRAAVDRYLASYNLRSMEWIVTSIDESHDNENLLEKFQSYVDAEEKRIESMLESFQYEIDAQNSLLLITGPGRIEKYIMPLIYLVLKHHCTMLENCSTSAVDDDLLFNASRTWETCFEALSERLTTLIAVYKQQHLQPEDEIKRHSYGMFEYMYRPELFEQRSWLVESLSDLTEKQSEVHDRKLAHQVDHADLDLGSYDELKGLVTTNSLNDAIASGKEGTHLLQAFWDGFYDDTWGENRMCTSIRLHGRHSFSGSGSDMVGAFEIEGDLVTDREFGSLCIKFRKTYKDGVVWHYNGHVDDEFEYIRGRWGRGTGKVFEQRGQFTLRKRSIISSLRRRPSPKEFQANRPKALWSVARTAVQQHLWTWSFFKARRDARLRFIDLYSRHMIAAVWGNHIYSPDLSPIEKEEIQDLEHTLGSRDTRFYVSYAKRNVKRKVTVHNVHCDSCQQPVLGARTFCVDCTTTASDSVDLCHEHAEETVDFGDGKVHYPYHLLLKIRRYVHYRQMESLQNQARKAGARSMELWAATAASREEAPDADSSPPVETSIPLRCSCCQEVLTRPCWFCVTCQDDSFLCQRCEVQEGSCLTCPGERHDFTHPFIRCIDPATIRVIAVAKTETETVEERLSNLEQRFTKHSDAMDTRLDNLESLLKQILVLIPQTQARAGTQAQAQLPSPASPPERHTAPPPLALPQSRIQAPLRSKGLPNGNNISPFPKHFIA